ncbi:hypothetical protein [Corynebacterium meridianum]|uniref:Uncharacterized protein n=1 Tax=Corynebacterium meridianum TaxID=2765363 RepID=A0A934M7V5_9CORY|nr:hypothetical protein [Corynebacterium meridianum]MBI8988430.1 hypothetical protein [Corynebacterium meridianum]
MSIINVCNWAYIALREEREFIELNRGSTFAGVSFDGGVGVLLSKDKEL